MKTPKNQSQETTKSDDLVRTEKTGPRRIIMNNPKNLSQIKEKWKILGPEPIVEKIFIDVETVIKNKIEELWTCNYWNKTKCYYEDYMPCHKGLDFACDMYHIDKMCHYAGLKLKSLLGPEK